MHCGASQHLLFFFLKEVKTLLNINKIVKIKVAAVVASLLNFFFFSWKSAFETEKE